MPSDFEQIPWEARYAGQWVAVKDGAVVANAPDTVSVYRSLRDAGIRGAVIQLVPKVRPRA